jgi:plasmid stabilization system protein ParE
MIGYDFHPEARLDIDEIWEFIGADNLDAADRRTRGTFAAVRALVPFPHPGHGRLDRTSRPLRFILVHNHLTAYAPDEKPLWVVAARLVTNVGTAQHGATASEVVRYYPGHPALAILEDPHNRALIDGLAHSTFGGIMFGTLVTLVLSSRRLKPPKFSRRAGNYSAF